MFVLLDDPEDWVHRRVETVSFLDASSVHRHMSVDFDLPDEDARPESGPPLVPLTLLEKRPLVNLDVRDEGGAACPVLNADENGFVAWSLLARVVQVVLADATNTSPDVPRHILEDLKRIAGGPPDIALSTLEAITDGPDPRLRQRLALPLFQEYAEWMATKFLLLVEVPDTNRIRRVMKFSYAQPLERVASAKRQRWAAMAGWRPAQFDVDVEGVGESQTYHCEFQGPQGLEVSRSELVVRASWTAAVQRYPREVVGSRAHIYASDAPLGAESVASIWLISPRSGLVRAALFTCAVISAVFLFSFVDDRITQVSQGLTLPLLLAAPGVVAGLVLRPGEHRIATDLPRWRPWCGRHFSSRGLHRRDGDRVRGSGIIRCTYVENPGYRHTAVLHFSKRCILFLKLPSRLGGTSWPEQKKDRLARRSPAGRTSYGRQSGGGLSSKDLRPERARSFVRPSRAGKSRAANPRGAGRSGDPCRSESLREGRSEERGLTERPGLDPITLTHVASNYS